MVDHCDPLRQGFESMRDMGTFLKAMQETRNIFDKPADLLKELVSVKAPRSGKTTDPNAGKHPM